MSGKPICVLLLCADAELARPILTIFDRLGDRVEVCHVASPPLARRQAYPLENAPQLIVVVQTWPDEFSTGDVIELLATYPVARLVCLEGVWCDSVGRNRQLWPLACRCRLEAAPVRLAHELAHFGLGRDEFQLAAGMPERPSRFLPLTASRAEVFADEFASSERRLPAGLLLAVDSPDRSFREMLESSLSRAGFRSWDRKRPEAPDLLVWDADLWSAAAALRLQGWQQQYPALPIVACAGFLRPDLTDELIGRGVVGFWFKLAPLAQLFDAITAAAVRLPSGCETTDRSWGRAPAG